MELTRDDCNSMAGQLDVAYQVAIAHPRGSDALAAGATPATYVAGVGARFVLRAPSPAFNHNQPDTLLYDGTGSDAQLVGLEWNVTGAEPAGFTGAMDGWLSTGPSLWTLRLWIVRPFENRVDPFAATHPCLDASGAIYDVTAPCYLATHPDPFEILVTNDDGYNAGGIDAVVEGLRTLPGVNVTVVAPALNQSGSSDRTTEGGVTSFAGQTLSGYPATAVNGYPADSVIYALKVQRLTPDLVVSGINNGQNIGPFVPLSGTAGAARVASRNGIPSVASSAGFGSPPDYPSATTAVLDWVEDFRLGRAGPGYQEVANINVPTCTAGAIRGVVEVPTALDFGGRSPHPPNCTSTATDPVDDVDGFLYGYITLSDIGRG